MRREIAKEERGREEGNGETGSARQGARSGNGYPGIFTPLAADCCDSETHLSCCSFLPPDQSEPGVAVVERVSPKHSEGGGGWVWLRVAGRLVHLSHGHHTLPEGSRRNGEYEKREEREG